MRRSGGSAVFPILLALVLMMAAWIWWAEGHPHAERRLRVLVQDQLEHWFPETMAPLDGWHGLVLRVPGVAEGDSAARPRVLLVHGLDEPGGIWDDLVFVLGAADFEVWELRYPNDQGIDRSTDLLAELWSGMPADRPVVLIGHSMGGLVVRDFVTRWRHPVDAAAKVEGASVRAVILVGTPNQGSEWARLRVWLELRDHFAADSERRFSLFAGLRDGTGAAKVDLRPGSDFLRDLNARPWPDSVPIRLIGGLLTEPPEAMTASLEAISTDIEAAKLTEALHDWWSSLGEGLGDGVVPLASLEIPGAPKPLLVRASHRGMLARLRPGDPEPVAIPHIVATLEKWADP